MVTVSAFQLDKYLVTVGRFRQFVKAWAGGWLPVAGSGKHTHLNNGNGLKNATGPGYEPGWAATDSGGIAPTNAALACSSNTATRTRTSATWTNLPGDHENLPIDCVTAAEAYAFCIWDGGFLPTDGEWEYAVAGGEEQREYPWGSADPGTANQYAIYNCNYPSGSGSGTETCGAVSNIAPVGTATLGAGRWGQLDLVGNVWEWNLDWYGQYFDNADDPCLDCADVTPGYQRLFRGGDYAFPADFLSPSPFALSPDWTARGSMVGFRCARSP
jgi:formylglycine-generating enzyme required for sulfatase activity